MKKILLLFTLLLSFCFIQAQNPVLITGVARPEPDRQYNYRITTAAHGISGTKAKWTIENGEFISPTGGTTLEQDVDIMSVDVIWTKVNSSGVLKYSYSNGSGAPYTGQINVSIEPASTSGGTKIEIAGVKKLYVGDQTTFNFRGLPTTSKVTWHYDINYLESVNNSAHDGRSITLKVKPMSGVITTTISADSKDKNGNHSRSLNIVLVGNPKIVPVGETIINQGNTSTYSIQGAQEYPGATIVWTSGDRMALNAGQGTGVSAVFTGSGNGYGIAKATVNYMGFVYNLQNSDVWIGKPAKPTRIEDLISGSQFKSYTEYFFYAGNIPGATNYSWRIAGDAIIISGSADRMVRVQTKPVSNGGSFALYLTAKNQFGQTEYGDHGIIASGGGIGGGGDIGIEKRSMLVADQSETKSVKVYNLSGILVYSNEAVNGVFDISSTILTNGVYIIDKFDGENRTSEKVILKR